MSQTLHVRPTASGPLRTDIEPAEVGMRHLGLKIVELEPGASYEGETGGSEVIILSLYGSFAVAVDGGEKYDLLGRSDPITQISDYVYLGPGTTFTVLAVDGGKFAIPGAVTDRVLPNRYVSAHEVGTAIRGAGSSSRQINSLVGIGAGDSASLIVGEILTPEGGWSSYPAHKHDEATENESVLEEIYYYEISDGAGPEGSGFAYQRVLSADDRALDLLVEARSGDTIAIPFGWHGPVAAAPGHDVYNLYIMAGPTGRDWKITDHPEQSWIRDTWEGIGPNPRLPLASVAGNRNTSTRRGGATFGDS